MFSQHSGSYTGPLCTEDQTAKRKGWVRSEVQHAVRQHFFTICSAGFYRPAERSPVQPGLQTLAQCWPRLHQLEPQWPTADHSAASQCTPSVLQYIHILAMEQDIQQCIIINIHTFKNRVWSGKINIFKNTEGWQVSLRAGHNAQWLDSVLWYLDYLTW